MQKPKKSKRLLKKVAHKMVKKFNSKISYNEFSDILISMVEYAVSMRTSRGLILKDINGPTEYGSNY